MGMKTLRLFSLFICCQFWIDLSQAGISLQQYYQITNLTQAQVQQMLENLINNPPSHHPASQPDPDNPSTDSIVSEAVASQDNAHLFDSFPASMTQSHNKSCKLRMTAVPVPPDLEPGWYVPEPCVEVQRCVGCCTHEDLTCEPIATSEQQETVFKVHFNSLNQMDEVRYEVINFVRHEVGCKCGCKIKASDCDPLRHTYDEDSCQCECNNIAQANCMQNQIWDRKLCRCMCRDVIHCHSHEVFDFNSCSCQNRAIVGSDSNNNVGGGGGGGSSGGGTPVECTTTCRAPYRLDTVNCACVPASDWGQEAGQAGGDGIGVSHAQPTATNAPTTVAVRPRPRPRPRPRRVRGRH